MENSILNKIKKSLKKKVNEEILIDLIKENKELIIQDKKNKILFFLLKKISVIR